MNTQCTCIYSYYEILYHKLPIFATFVVMWTTKDQPDQIHIHVHIHTLYIACACAEQLTCIIHCTCTCKCKCKRFNVYINNYYTTLYSVYLSMITHNYMYTESQRVFDLLNFTAKHLHHKHCIHIHKEIHRNIIHV